MKEHFFSLKEFQYMAFAYDDSSLSGTETYIDYKGKRQFCPRSKM